MRNMLIVAVGGVAVIAIVAGVYFGTRPPAAGPAPVAVAAAPDKFFERADKLFRNQVEWLSQGDPLVEMVRVLAPDGVTEEQAQACFADDRALDKVLADVQSGQALGVRATPALFINDQAYSNPGTADAIAAILRQVGR